jgi:hypothetical protein
MARDDELVMMLATVKEALADVNPELAAALVA